MARWAELEAAEPEFAARVRRLLDGHKHKTMATLRKHGGPRISGTEAEFVDEDLRIGSMPGAVKALDLRRDPRVALHSGSADADESNPGGWPGDAKVAGRAVEIEPNLFRIDLEEVVLTHVEPPDQLVIESWHPGRGYQRRQRT